MKKIEKTVEIGGKKIIFTTGHLAEQATSSVEARSGDTVVLATVVSAPIIQDLGYFPLSVQYQERLYAGGVIKGSRWVKREGKPTDDDVLISRLIDRFIRPLFPKEYEREVQIVITVLSVDRENSPDMVAAAAVSCALGISSIPWQGPVAPLRIGKVDQAFVVNPLVSEIKNSEIDLIVATTKENILMIEAGLNEVDEKEILAGVEFAIKEGKGLIAAIEAMGKEVGKEKEKVEKAVVNTALEKKIKELTIGPLTGLLKRLASKDASYYEFLEVKKATLASFTEEERTEASGIFDLLVERTVREMLIAGKRPDGRKMDELRDLSGQVGILPRTHGSAVFTRGQTQVMSIVTLGPPSLEQLIETAEGEETKRYMHHYSMPPYSVGEAGRMGPPSRREIGHGALAERALMPVIPAEDEFPYAIRVVSEVLSSNGSTSMAAVCGSTLSLMDAGVPIKSPVAGIAMGLAVESKEKYSVLTDIVGLEDANGDMDFKVAGTKAGVTALQLDVKTKNLTPPILKEALTQAKEARLKILDVITKTLAEPRSELSAYAPKVKSLKIPQDKIGEVIGPGGRVIKALIAETGAEIDVEEDGTVNVSSMDKDSLEAALDKIKALTKEVKKDEVYEGTVTRLQPFGAHVEILPNKEGLVHVSEMSTDFVKTPGDVVKRGDKVKVRVKEIDDLGRINLSMIFGEKRKPEGRRDFSRQDPRRGGSRRRDDRRRSSGPHFPTSRLLSDKKGY